MMKKVGGGYKIEISEKQLLSSMRFIKDLRDFFREQKSEEASLMQTAIEAMILVYSEKFGGDACES